MGLRPSSSASFSARRQNMFQQSKFSVFHDRAWMRPRPRPHLRLYVQCSGCLKGRALISAPRTGLERKRPWRSGSPLSSFRLTLTCRQTFVFIFLSATTPCVHVSLTRLPDLRVNFSHHLPLFRASAASASSAIAAAIAAAVAVAILCGCLSSVMIEERTKRFARFSISSAS